ANRFPALERRLWMTIGDINIHNHTICLTEFPQIRRGGAIREVCHENGFGDLAELEAHYMYMAKLQQVSPDAVDSGPIFDKEPEQKVQNDDHYDVFAIECQHTVQSESAHNTYLLEQDAQNVSIELVDMNYDSEQIDQNDEDINLAKERELLAS
nr:hypothetical protein [Tanacetum cinerariifolium]